MRHPLHVLIPSAQGRSVPRVPPGEIDRLTVGPYCDVYPGPEAELGINRRALEVLDERTCSPGPAISSGSR